jgi:hypothetical protein
MSELLDLCSSTDLLIFFELKPLSNISVSKTLMISDISQVLSIEVESRLVIRVYFA